MTSWRLGGNKSYSERAKMALIPVLLVAFGGVMYGRLHDRSSGSQPVAVKAIPAPATGEAGSTSAAINSEGKARPRQRMQVDLPDVIAHNPFRTPVREEASDNVEPTEPSTADEPADVEPAPSLAASDETAPKAPPRRWPVKVQAVFVDQRGAAAIVDGKVIHVGDILESGACVVEINSNSVTFEMP